MHAAQRSRNARASQLLSVTRLQSYVAGRRAAGKQSIRKPAARAASPLP
jgi:hypothetical protein